MGNPLDPPIKQIIDELNVRNAAKLPIPLQPEWFSLETPVPILGDPLHNTKATLRVKVVHATYRGAALINYSRLPLDDTYGTVLEPLQVAGGPTPLLLTHAQLAQLIDAQWPFDLAAHIESGSATITSVPTEFTLRAKQFSDKFIGDLVVTASFAFNGTVEFFLNATTAMETRPAGTQVANTGIVGAGRVRYWNASYENGVQVGTPEWVTQLAMGPAAFALPDYFLSVMGDATNGVTAFVHPGPMAYTSLATDAPFQAWKASNPIARIELLNAGGGIVTTLVPRINDSVFDNPTSANALMLTDYHYIYSGADIVDTHLGFNTWPADPAALQRVRVVYN